MEWLSAAPGMLGSGRPLEPCELYKDNGKRQPSWKRYEYFADGFGWFPTCRELAEAMGVDHKKLFECYSRQQKTYNGIEIDRREKGVEQ